MHPKCACGCGRLATIVADVVFPTGIDCRAPWVNIEHALGAQSTNLRPTIDIVVDSDAMPAILSASPCWCQLRRHTNLYWCPQHGTDITTD
jgi:hypothetical protein